ncbi:unnamed protein product, partial [Meganyctiphanes norvegica]
YMMVWVASVTVYCNGLSGDFVHDDISAIKTNPDVLGVTPVHQLFLNDYWGKPLHDHTSHKSYRPLTILTFRLNHSLFGLGPLHFHVVNVLLHSSVSLLLVRLLLTVVHLPPGTVLAAGLIFATHPIHTEAVTGLVGRADVLAALALLASLLTYHRVISNGPSRDTAYRHHWGAWGPLRQTGSLALVGMLCKEHGLTALAVSAAWDLMQHRKHKRRLSGLSFSNTSNICSRLFALVIMGALMLGVRLWLLRGTTPVFSDQDNPAAAHPHLLTRILTWAYLPAFNFWLLLCPFRLSHDWQLGSLPLVTSLKDPRNLASLTFYLLLVVLATKGILTRGCKQGRGLLLGMFLMVLPFLPASNVFITVGFVVAERILYIPSLGFSVLIAMGLSRLGRLRVLFLLYLLLLFSVRTLYRNRDWSSRETLFSAGLKSVPENAKMHYNYANLMKDMKELDVAKIHYKEAIRLWPGHSSAHNNLGTLVEDQVTAEHHFSMAIKYHPHHRHAHYNLALLRQEQGRLKEAMLLLEESLRHDANYHDAVAVLANLYTNAGRYRDAENLHLTLLATNSADPVAHCNYAVFLSKNGHEFEALRHYEAALSLENLKEDEPISKQIRTTVNYTTQTDLLYT